MYIVWIVLIKCQLVHFLDWCKIGYRRSNGKIDTCPEFQNASTYGTKLILIGSFQNLKVDFADMGA